MKVVGTTKPRMVPVITLANEYRLLILVADVIVSSKATTARYSEEAYC